jgi:hypothetical protein
MAMDPNYFWRTPRVWPDVMPGFVFLASAVQQIGKARYPVSWTGDEPWTRVSAPLPEHQPDATHAQVRQAYSLIGREPDEITLPAILPRGAQKHSIPRPLSPDDWASAQLASLRVTVPRAEKAARWHDVMWITCALFRSGGLHCHVRETPGGDYYGPLDPAKCWNTELEKVTARFGLCQVDLKNLYGQTAYEAHGNIRLSSYSQQDFRYMFVDERSLANSVEAMGKMPPPPDWIADKPSGAQMAAAKPPVPPVVADAPPEPVVKSASPSGQNDSQPRRKRRAASAQQKAIAAWLIAKGHKSWPDDESDRAIADLVTDWTETQGKYVVVGPRLVENWRKSERARLFFESRKSK